MTRRVPSARFLGAARLEGHELRFHKRGWKDGTGKANAFHSSGADAVVHGVVYEVAEEELPALDVFETGYERRLLGFSITLQREAEAVQAWVYLALPEVIDDALVPTRAYLDHVLAGARAHGLPTALIEKLEGLPTEG